MSNGDRFEPDYAEDCDTDFEDDSCRVPDEEIRLRAPENFRAVVRRVRLKAPENFRAVIKAADSQNTDTWAINAPRLSLGQRTTVVGTSTWGVGRGRIQLPERTTVVGTSTWGVGRGRIQLPERTTVVATSTWGIDRGRVLLPERADYVATSRWGIDRPRVLLPERTDFVGTSRWGIDRARVLLGERRDFTATDRWGIGAGRVLLGERRDFTATDRWGIGAGRAVLGARTSFAATDRWDLSASRLSLGVRAVSAQTTDSWGIGAGRIVLGDRLATQAIDSWGIRTSRIVLPSPSLPRDFASEAVMLIERDVQPAAQQPCVAIGQAPLFATTSRLWWFFSSGVPVPRSLFVEGNGARELPPGQTPRIIGVSLEPGDATTPADIQVTFRVGNFRGAALDVTPALEQSHVFMEITVGGLSLVLPGPNSSIATRRDSNSPYDYEFAHGTATQQLIAAFVTGVSRLSGGARARAQFCFGPSRNTVPVFISRALTMRAGSDFDVIRGAELRPFTSAAKMSIARTVAPAVEKPGQARLSASGSGTSVTATVGAPTSGGAVAEYEIQLSESNEFPIDNTQIPLTILTRERAGSSTFDSLVRGRTYYVRAKAVNAGGSGAWSATRTVTLPVPASQLPGAPSVSVTFSGSPGSPGSPGSGSQFVLNLGPARVSAPQTFLGWENPADGSGNIGRIPGEFMASGIAAYAANFSFRGDQDRVEFRTRATATGDAYGSAAGPDLATAVENGATFTLAAGNLSITFVAPNDPAATRRRDTTEPYLWRIPSQSDEMDAFYTGYNALTTRQKQGTTLTVSLGTSAPAVAPTPSSLKMVVDVTAPTAGGTPTAYEIQASTSADFPTSGLLKKTLSSAGSVEFANVAPNTTYYVRARASNSAGAGPWSAVQTAVRWQAPAAPVIRLTASQTSVTASVSPPPGSGRPSSYEVELSNSSSFPSASTTKVSVSGASGSHKFGSLNASTTYHVRARAKNSHGTGPWASATIVTQSRPKVTFGLEAAAVMVQVGQSVDVDVQNVSPSGATIRAASSNSRIAGASISGSGATRTIRITGVAKGTARITVTGTALNHTAADAQTISVEVVAAPDVTASLKSPTNFTATVRE